MDSKPCFKRVKERSVWEAKLSVDRWRQLFKEGTRDSAGNILKLTLKQAAEHVGIPKKTLEDYHQLLRKVEQITPLEELKNKKMGYLRQFLKENKKIEEEDAGPQQQFDEYDEDLPAHIEEEVQMQSQMHPPLLLQDDQNGDEWQEMIVEGEVPPILDLDDDYFRGREYTPAWAEQTQQYAGYTQFVNMVHTIHYDNLPRMKEDCEVWLDFPDSDED